MSLENKVDTNTIMKDQEEEAKENEVNKTGKDSS